MRAMNQCGQAIKSLVISAGLLVAGAAQDAPQTLELGAVLPLLRGETLQGNPLALPDAATGKIAFLTITFSKKAGTSARAWNERFVKDHTAQPSVTNYSVAMLESAPKILRGMIRFGIKKGVPKQARDRFLVVTSDEAPWKQYLNVTDDDLPYLVLIDAGSRVIWKDQGAFDEAKYEVLRSKISPSTKREEN